MSQPDKNIDNDYLNEDDNESFILTDSSPSPPFPRDSKKYKVGSAIISLIPNPLKKFYNNVILNNVGIFLTLLSQMFNSVMVLTCKLLLLDEDFDEPLHPLQILFVRMIVTFAICSIFLYKDPDFPLGPKGYRKYMLGRGIGGFIGVFGQYFSLIYLSVSDTVVITFLAPTITSFVAFVFLKERFTKVEALCGSIAFFGVILISRPSFIFGDYLAGGDPSEANGSGREVETSSSSLRLLGSASALMSCFGTAVAMCSIRKISFNAKPLLTVSFFAMTTVIISFLGLLIIPGLSFQMPHTSKQWILLAVIGIAGFVMQYLLTAGIQREKAARAISMSYSQLIYATVLDYLFFHHIPSGLSILGTFIIICAVVSIIYFKPENEENLKVPDIENNADVTIINDSISLDNLTLDEFDIDANSFSTDDLPK